MYRMHTAIQWAIGTLLTISIMHAEDYKAMPTFKQPVDIVYLWVDGNDPEWQKIKNTELALLIKRYDAYTDNRFSNHEELRYSLRSIWKYAPFVNHIYIVTMNQRPHWLLDHPKITIIDHTQIFKRAEDLPTFNSHALESNLHRIPNLNEYFIYFNDDVFLGAPVNIADFFTLDGRIKVLFEKSFSPSGPEVENETMYRKAWRNTNEFLDTHYKPEQRLRLCHAPFALRKSMIERAESEFGFIFESNSSHKFRSPRDFNMVNGLLQYYWLYHDEVAPGGMSNIMVSLRTDATLERTVQRLDKIKKKRFQTFCLQDAMSGDESKETNKALRQFLEAYYSTPAPWEKK